ncbi:UDP-3-O-[3-hydroxymyristoyl] N-acetylglucosamine deacetylase [bacterium]|nr:UDP-3-O-[3-hydroxymyristoyl] N-acetylglucosamine deacetylase [candidate division CSSED10-310 bacterium]
MEIQQQTLKHSVKFSGIGLHSGKKITGILHPAPEDSGILFQIKNRDSNSTAIPARFRNIGGLSYNTGLQSNGVSVLTVEHLLSALNGLQIDNAIVELNNGEVPVMDGSAAPFVYLLSEAGIVQQKLPRRVMRLVSNLRVERDGAWIEAEPSDSDRLEIEYSIDFNHPVIGKMQCSYVNDPVVYCRAIAPARTFGFLKEVEYLRSKGLIKGASLKNAVVLDDQRIISGSLRFPDEFVRHKILDFWGDIVLLGRPLIAKIKAHRAGHKLHAMLVEQLLKTPGILEPALEKTPHRIFNLVPKLSCSS